MSEENDLVLRIECQLKSFFCKRRFPIFDWTLRDLRAYIEQLLNISSTNLILRLHSEELLNDHDDSLLCHVAQFTANDRILVDSRCPADDIDDLNRLHDKYRMSDDVYAQRKGTLREYLRAHQLGQYNPDRQTMKTVQSQQELRRANRLKLKKIDIGMKVTVTEPMCKPRLGEIVYIGMLRGIHDEFVGVLFDSPCGDSNGCDGEIQYFTAKAKHASFVRPEYINTEWDGERDFLFLLKKNHQC